MSEELNNRAQEEEAIQAETMPDQDCQSSAEEGTTTDTADIPATEVSIEEQLARLQDNHLRLMAEYENYRKRTLKEKSDLIRNGGEKVLRDLLPVIDDIDIALTNIESTDDIDAVREGIRLIHGKFVDYLSRQGVQPIATESAPFDEELHEAIATFPAPSEELKGRIIDCVKKGYTLHDKVLRHSSVVVGQ